MAPDHSRMVMPPNFAPGSADRLSALPDEILQHILSFLPAQEAVRTCVLAQSWRHIWKLLRCLHITGTTTPTNVGQVRGFVDGLLQARLDMISRSPLDMCEIKFDMFNDDDEDFIDRWIGYVVECRVKWLSLNIFDTENDDHIPWYPLPELPLFSPYLTRLDLYGIQFSESFAHFSSMPALQNLKIEKCDLSELSYMESPSLRRLSMDDCISCPNWRFRISVPQLLWLWLHIPSADRTPQLESMPNLVAAYVNIDWCLDVCTCEGDRMDCCHVNQAAYNYSYSDIDDSDEEGSDDSHASDDYDEESFSDDDDDDHDKEGFSDNDNSNKVTRKYVLLGGLSEATDLTLISAHNMFVFRRDLRWCPTFSKLRTLLINDYWCEPPDCCALARILEHSPILEKLTIVLSDKGPKYKIEMKGCLKAVLIPSAIMISEHLRIVELKCDVVNDTFHNVLRFLDSLNIWFPCEEEKASDEEKYTTQVLSPAK